jgi:acyl-coenzyme A synthetase/AMP-(fatty) acid ligase
MQLVVTDPAFARCNGLRLLFCGGEPMSARLQREIFARTRADLISQYGPTEATVDATWCRIDREAISDPAPIGRPIANTQVFILDDQLQPTPPGTVGELHLGGLALARGYLNRPELTAQSFIPHPFDATPGARLYKTGDLGRQRADGMLEFLGRADQQVKLRGHRVELGEIETVLRQCPAVEQAVVALRRLAPDDPRLVGYVKWRAEERDGPVDLRSFLLARLPDHMVPAQFVTLAEFPLTPTGKIDRRALPEPEAGRPEPDRPYVAPRTELETALAGLWAEALGLPRVGVEDDFFALGGHSLLAARVVARLRQDYQLDFSLGEFLRHPTIAALARTLEERLLAEVSALTDAEARSQLR